MAMLAVGEQPGECEHANPALTHGPELGCQSRLGVDGRDVEQVNGLILFCAAVSALTLDTV